MTAATAGQIKSNIEKYNSENYVYVKTLTRYLFVYIISFAVGILSFYFLDFPFTEKINSYIYGHFSYLFEGCKSFSEYFHTVLRCSNVDIKHMIFIFTAGFTMFSSIAVAGINAYRGLSLGFSVGYAALAFSNGTININHAKLAFTVFLLANVFISSAMLSLSAKSVIFSYDFRKLCGRKSLIIKSPLVYTYIFGCLMMFGFTLIINFIRCILSGVYSF